MLLRWGANGLLWMTRVQAARGAVDLGPLVLEWQHLSADAAEPNVFYEPFMLVPAVGALAAAKGVVTLFVRSDGGQLIGVFPLKRRLCSTTVPVPHYALWKHPYCYLCTPLIRRGEEATTLGAVFDWVAWSGAALRLGPHPVGGNFDEALQAFVGSHHRVLHTSREYDRPLVQTTLGPDAYLAECLSTRKRKQLRRFGRRLAEQGAVAFHTSRTPAEVERAIAQFVALEHKGWKGREGSSFASNSQDRAFLDRAALLGSARGQVEVRSMTLDDVPIAMSITLKSAVHPGGRGGAYAFKIAYDEDHHTSSPGVLLDVEMFRELLADPAIGFVDSCSDPDYPMSDPQWAERRSIRLATVTRDSWLGWTVAASGLQLETASRAAKSWVTQLDPKVLDGLKQIRRVIRP